MDVVLSPYEDPSAGLDWPEQTPQILEGLKSRIESWDGAKVEYRIRETNHGLGADWPTITLQILSLSATAFFVIPAAHKKIRESIEEWRKIKANVERFIAWVSPKKKIASYPVELLFLDCADQALETDASERLEFLGWSEVPVPAEVSGGFTAIKHYIFTFRSATQITLVAIDNRRQVLWIRSTPV
ncbi:MAG: hypothetical protein K2X06_12370 [Burkholderiales bacterium]|nr:hypothetical protein [Burkholderiales bacterium]